MSVAAIALSTLLDRGLLDYYAYNGQEAYRAYARAATAYPDAAMAYWGEALALGPNINEPLTQEHFEAAQPAIAKALSLSAIATPRDRDLIAALALRYAGTWKQHDPDDDAYRAALAPLVAKYPNDDTVAMLDAEAIADGNGDWHRVAQLAFIVLARDPQHPMANHLCVHAYDDAVDRSPAIPCARRLDAMTFLPEQEHLAHMPAHTWIETGAYALAVASSERSYDLVERLMADPTLDQAHAGYAGHDTSIGFVATMYLGNYAQARRWQDREARNSTPSSVSARFGKWNDLLASTRADDATLPTARALAFTHLGRWNDARSAYTALPSAQKDGVLGVLANARLNEHDGKIETAVSRLRWLAKRQYATDSDEYLPAYPAIEAVGGIYLRAARYADAVTAYTETLAHYPQDPRALFGLATAYDRLGETTDAANARAAFERQWAGADTTPTLDDL